MQHDTIFKLSRSARVQAPKPQGAAAEASPAEQKLLALLHRTRRYQHLHLQQMRRRETMKLDELHALSIEQSPFGAAGGVRAAAGGGPELLAGLPCLTTINALQLRQTTMDLRMAKSLRGALQGLTGLKVCTSLTAVHIVDF